MLKFFKSYLSDESGQTSTEYILLVAVVVMIVMKFKSIAVEKLGELTEDIFGKTGSKISDELDQF